MEPFKPAPHSRYRAKAHFKDHTDMNSPWTVQKRIFGIFWKTIRVGEFGEMINLSRSLFKQDQSR